MTHQSSRRSPLNIQNETSFKRLDDEGDVLIAYGEDKNDGKVWVKHGWTGSKQFDAVREKFDVLTRHAFLGFAGENHERAGFESGEDWVGHVEERYGELPKHVFVYEVRKEEDN